MVGRESFPDHAPYSPDTIMRLAEAAQQADAVPVTTAKDHVRLPVEARPMAEVLRVSLRFDDPDAVGRFLQERLPRA
ncbi:tetraacyldisaccharide 4'-kinase [Ferrovibrio sp.]|uniref:tetraacyldisaccharide 4'-kinase n=1 Tax=Ferrovibrio sp. TaxID=1917215 RepID=UPI0035301010